MQDRNETLDDSLLSTEGNSWEEDYNVYFPMILAHDEDIESWEEAAEDLYAEFNGFITNKLKCLKVMKRARIIALKTPNHKLRKIYSDLIAKLQKRYPTKLDFMDYTEGSFSKFFKRANIPSFEDIDAFFNNRDKEPADVQTKYDSSAEEKKKVHANRNTTKEDVDYVMIEIFNFYNGVFPNCYRFLLFFPDYLIHHWRSFQEVVRDGAPFSFEECLLFGMMVADLLKCNYIKQLLYRKFSLWGGNLDWEKNPEENLPSRILQLRMLIITMMFSPHNLTSSNTPINNLLGVGEDKISVHQLIHLSMIVSVFSNICNICILVGIQAETDETDKLLAEENEKTCDLLNVLEGLEKVDESRNKDYLNHLRKIEESNIDEDDTGAQTDLDSNYSLPNDRDSATISITSLNDSLTKKGDDDSGVIGGHYFKGFDKKKFKYQKEDFKNKKEYLKNDEFSFKSHGHLVYEKFLPKMSSLLSQRIVHIKVMTFTSFGQFEDVNTAAFRRAIRMYTQSLYGFYRSNYNYSKIDSIFREEENNEKGKSAKKVFKLIATNPHKLRIEDYNLLLERFNLFTHELIHILFLVIEAKMEIVLAYSSYYVDRYLSIIDE